MSKDKKQPKEKKEAVSSFELQNYMLKPLRSWLNAPLHSEQAVARNRVVKILDEKISLFETDRMELVNKYGKKDTEGELIIGENGYEFEDMKTFAAEYEVISTQPAIFDLLPSNRVYWKGILPVIKNTQEEMDIFTTEIWEQVIEIIGKI